MTGKGMAFVISASEPILEKDVAGGQGVRGVRWRAFAGNGGWILFKKRHIAGSRIQRE
jgi:hypothetical protein